MTDAWVGVVASLGGVALGTGTAYFTQERHWIRQSRLQTYGEFVGECRLWFDSLIRLSYTLRHNFSDERRRPYWDNSNNAKERVNRFYLQVELLATTAALVIAVDLVDQLSRLNSEIYDHEQDKTMPEADEVYKERIEPVLEQFVQACRRELGRRRRRNTRHS